MAARVAAITKSHPPTCESRSNQGRSRAVDRHDDLSLQGLGFRDAGHGHHEVVNVPLLKTLSPAVEATFPKTVVLFLAVTIAPMAM